MRGKRANAQRFEWATRRKEAEVITQTVRHKKDNKGTKRKEGPEEFNRQTEGKSEIGGGGRHQVGPKNSIVVGVSCEKEGRNYPTKNY